MSKEALRASIEVWIRQIDQGIEQARRRLAEGGVADHVKAAGELGALEVRRHDLERRLAQLEAEPEGRWETARSEIEAVANDASAAVQRWLSTH